jgi:agmatine/peptidylarginine deiminase
MVLGGVTVNTTGGGSGIKGEGEPRPRPAGQRILVVEDNRDSADSLRLWLELSGHEVAVGVRKVVWLPGSKADEVTDGHVDGIAAFARPGLAVAEVTPDRHDPEYEALQENLQELRQATDANGRRLEVVVVRRPTGLRPRSKKDFCASHVNFYLANGAVVMPKFGEEGADEAARDVIAKAFPERTVAQVALRCITLHQPAAR